MVESFRHGEYTIQFSMANPFSSKVINQKVVTTVNLPGSWDLFCLTRLGKNCIH
jgi:hypothetical protein